MRGACFPSQAPHPSLAGRGAFAVHRAYAVQFVLCTVGGLLLIAAVVVDLVWTTLGTHGGGPLTVHGMRNLWRGVIALHRRRPAHPAPSFARPAMLALTAIALM